jgi:hypothetical protein
MPIRSAPYRPICWLTAVTVLALLAAPGAALSKGRAKPKGIQIALPKPGNVTVAVLTPKPSRGGRKGKPGGKLKIKNRAGLPKTVTILSAKGRGKASGKTLLVLLNRAATTARRTQMTVARGVTTAGGTSVTELQLDQVGKVIAEDNYVSSSPEARRAFCNGLRNFSGDLSEFNFDQMPLVGALPGNARLPAVAKDATDMACGKETPAQARELGNTVNAPMTTTPPPPPPPTPATNNLCSDEVWKPFSGNELAMYLRFFLCGPPAGFAKVHAAATQSPIDAIKVVVPGGRQITNTLCPTQLPQSMITTTATANDTLICSGGSLPLGTNTTLNVQTSPAPDPGMGGQVYGRQDGAFKGPYSVRAGP